MIAYFNGRFLPKEDIHLSPDDRGFLFADGVYEVVRVYRGHFFEPALHWQRLERSLAEMHLPTSLAEGIHPIAERLIADNGLASTDAIVYLQITRGAAPRTHTFPDAATTPPTVYAFAKELPCPVEKWKKGVRAILLPDQRWARCDIKSVSLLPNTLAAQAARDHGADEAVLHRDGYLTEGTHTSLVAVREGRLYTAPLTPAILPGVTRHVVLQLCRQLSIGVEEFPIALKDIPQLNEMMLLGTTYEVTPVTHLDGIPIGPGEPGPVARRLQEAFQSKARG